MNKQKTKIIHTAFKDIAHNKVCSTPVTVCQGVLEANTLISSSQKSQPQWTVWKNVQWNELAAKHK